MGYPRASNQRQRLFLPQPSLFLEKREKSRTFIAADNVNEPLCVKFMTFSQDFCCMNDNEEAIGCLGSLDPFSHAQTF